MPTLFLDVDSKIVRDDALVDAIETFLKRESGWVIECWSAKGSADAELWRGDLEAARTKKGWWEDSPTRMKDAGVPQPGDYIINAVPFETLAHIWSPEAFIDWVLTGNV